MNYFKYYSRIARNVYFLNFKHLFNKKKVVLNEFEKKICNDLDKYGVAVVPNFFTEEECEALKKEIDSNIIKYSSTIWKDTMDSDNRIYNAEEISPLFKKYHTNKFILNIAESYLESEVVNQSTLASRTLFKKGNQGSGGGWHRDNPYRKQFKSVVYLDDVDSNNGPFSYYLGTHKTTNSIFKKIEGIQKYDYRLENTKFLNSVAEKKYEFQEYTAKKGTMLLLDTKGIHRGTPLKNNRRYTIFNYITPVYELKRSGKNMFDKLKVLRNS